MSAFRSRRGGRKISNVLSRKNRSSRNCSCADHLAEVAVGGAEDPDIDAERLVLADAADLAALEEPEQLDLDALVQLADLVEEERAAVGDLEEALPVHVGAGEGPLAMSEQLALDEVLGQGPAVHRDEGTVGSAALVVQVPRDQFLAGAGLAQDHHGRVGRGDRLDQPADLLHDRRLADQQGRPPSAALRRVSSAVVLLAMSRRSATRARITSSSAHLQGLVR